MVIAVTGHRPDKLGREYDMKGPYSDYISGEFDKIIETFKPETGISGLALGVDTLWAVSCLYHNIPLIAAVPFEGQEKMWPENSQRVYRQIIEHSETQVVYVCEPGYEGWKMQKRNVWMIDHCDVLVAVFDGSPGGTGNCVKAAEKIKKEIIRIDPRLALKF